MKKFNEIVLILCKSSNYVTCAVLVFMLVFILVYILLRAIFNYAIFGTFEIVQLSSMTMVACGLAYNEYVDGNITIDTLLEMSKPRGKRILLTFSLLVTTAITGFTAYKMVFYTFTRAAEGAITANLGIPIWVFTLILSVAFILLTLCLLFRLISTVTGYQPIPATETPEEIAMI